MVQTQQKQIKTLIRKKNRQIIKQNMKAHFYTLQNDIQETKYSIQTLVGNQNAKLVQPVLEELSELNFKVTELLEGLEKTFELFIVGMGNYGKSTLINALIEQDMADIDVRPKTWKVDVYDASLTNNQCYIAYKNGDIEYKTVEETQAFLQDEEAKTNKSKKEVKAELKKILPELKTKDEIRETKELLNKEFLYQSTVVEVRWPIAETNLSKKFMVVDTPGLVQENISGETIVSVQKYYHKADGVIWILDATKLASKKSNDMLQELENSLSKIGGKTDNIIAVINRIDLVRKNHWEDAEKKVLEEANKHFGKYFNNFICISAKQAYDSIASNNPNLREESGIDNLLKTIDANFYQYAQKIQLQSKEISFQQILRQMNEDTYPIQRYLYRLREDQRKYQTRTDKIIEKFSSNQRRYQREVNEIANSYLKETESRIDSYAENLFDLDSVSQKESYIKNKIFRLEQLQRQLEKLQIYWKKEIESMMKNLIMEVAFNEYVHLDQKMLQNILKGMSNSSSFAVPSTERVNTYHLREVFSTDFSSAGVFGVFIEEIADFLGITKKVAKFFKKGRLKKDLKDTINGQVNTVKGALVGDLEQLNEKAKNNVLKELDESFSNLHGPYENSFQIEKALIHFFEKSSNVQFFPSIKQLLINDKRKYEVMS